ncbi:hypothetical protein CHCC20335_0108 [Bacillus paralicheniformis]|nr:hypothetical protein [Bacillus sonorensis]TWK79331.1 hypothetical protein CHCC20335_0108 [Bacillus paralicheniformis]
MGDGYVRKHCIILIAAKSLLNNSLCNEYADNLTDEISWQPAAKR